MTKTLKISLETSLKFSEVYNRTSQMSNYKMKKMKKTVITTLILLSATHLSMAQTNPKLSAKIDSLYAIDQNMQQAIISASQNNATQPELQRLEKLKDEIFQKNIPLLKEILKKNGLPTYKLVGKKSSDNFMVMANHSFADIAFQKEVIHLANKETAEKSISGNQLALLTDKMLLKSGQKQIFGTQCTYKNGVAIAQPIANEKNVDKRRKKAGLTPLATYLSMMTELHQQMNKKY